MITIPITEDGFSEIHQTFLEEHYSHFDDSEENKFIYTDIFKQYVSIFLNLQVQLSNSLNDGNINAAKSLLKILKKLRIQLGFEPRTF